MNHGTILHICVSPRKGTAKSAVQHAVLREGHGLEGDAHAGAWHRQVSLLDDADIETMRARGLDLEPGAFGENLVISGLNLAELGPGSRLRIGPAVIEITQIGKECHDRCEIYHRVGDCIMPRVGVFTRVVKQGNITPGSPITVISRTSRGADSDCTGSSASSIAFGD